MTPRVSVVMPVYNGEAFIAEAVQSVFASSLTDLELVLVDDGSTDRSVEFAQAACGQDSRLRVIAGAHMGVADARNRALRAAQGEFIANLDSDDTMFPERLERQVAYLERHPECVAVGSRALFVDGSGHPTAVYGTLFTHDAIDGAHMEGRGGGIGNPTAMFRRDAALRVGGYEASNHSTGEDFDLWLRLAEIGQLANLRDVLVRYRVHGSNVSLTPAAREARWNVTLASLQRAFKRRGITDRVPAKVPAPPLSRAERTRNAALLAFYTGRRVTGVLRALEAATHVTSTAANWHVLRTVLGGAPSHPVTHPPR